ncbi:conserved hypothetical protein [Candidatus Accumulibacter aalborgensis]|uniref:ParE-like toxin domain-containing protein n=1 Tax=Candidatus Accumulibacter aalborgensis TaxID=1860102 RepID=A0A1A8XJH0_9PROT|nr:hypothetical protein [Candidatus Accumulibacter aalborgensis]SBT04537.1 conserved hypothetical protein [Candidatus Accumulibacter aalborgensis]
MISRATPKFWKCFRALPRDIQAKAKEAYTLFRDDPWYPSLNFKRVHSSLPVYSVRITKDYRAVGILGSDKIVWFWAGSHAQYDGLLKQIKNDR